jgi:hypothetical protein
MAPIIVAPAHGPRLARMEYTDKELANLRSLDFMKWLSCLIQCDGRAGAAAHDFALRFPRSVHLDRVQKAARDLMTTTKSDPGVGNTLSVGWAAPLAALAPLQQGFLDLNKPTNLLGKLDAFATHIPFNTSVPVVTSGSTFKWVPQGPSPAPKPVGQLQFASVTMSITKVGGILVLSRELAKLDKPGSDVAMRTTLSRDMSDFLDQQFTDPAVAAVAGSNPGSITNLAPTIGSSGTSQTNAATDFRALNTAFWAANPRARACVILTSPSNAVALANALNADTCGPDGGTLKGIQVFTGNVGARVVFMDPASLIIADSGGIAIDVSNVASVELNTIPTSPITASSVIISMWQANCVALKCERFINFRLAKPDAAVFTNQQYV